MTLLIVSLVLLNSSDFKERKRNLWLVNFVPQIRNLSLTKVTKRWVFSFSTCEQGLFMVVRLTMKLQTYLLCLKNPSLNFSLIKHRFLTYGKSLDKERLLFSSRRKNNYLYSECRPQNAASH